MKIGKDQANLSACFPRVRTLLKNKKPADIYSADRLAYPIRVGTDDVFPGTVEREKAN